MKILHVCSNYFPATGGPQYIMKHFSEMLVNDYGDEVEVATSNLYYGPEIPLHKTIAPAIETIANVKVHRFPVQRWHHGIIQLANKLTAKLTGKPLPHTITKYCNQMHAPGINKMMQCTDADIIMATTASYNFADYSAWRWKTKSPKPFILYGAIHFNTAGQCYAPFVERAKQADAYIANTSYEKERLVQMGINANKITVIGTGINPETLFAADSDIAAFKKTHGIDENDIVLGFVGRLKPGKGVDILLDAIEQIMQTHPQVKLILAGSATEFVSVIQDRIRTKALPVILLADFDENLKPILFHVMDMLVLPSTGESFGIVFLEAWACKKPVIGAGIGAVSTLIDDTKDGLLFTPGNTTSLIHAITQLVQNSPLRKQLGQAGYEKLMRLYTWPVIAKAYRDLYIHTIQEFNQRKSIS